MNALQLPQCLDDRKNILIAGAGGGFDVFAGLPLYEALIRQSKNVTLANLSVSYLGGTDGEQLLPNLYRIDARTEAGSAYFPEGVLTRFLEKRGRDVSVYAFEKTGVMPLRAAYEYIVEHKKIDALILVDGGTDILMRGDESGLGTPEEDMASLAAVAHLPIPTKLIYCLGFGIDTYHGICHAHFLENVASLAQARGFLGTTSLLAEMPEAQLYLDAVVFSEELMASHPSIVNTSIASAIEGRFGNHHRTERTQSSELFISPLMSMYWGFDLGAVVAQHMYLDSLQDTQSIWDVQSAIQAFRAGLPLRDHRSIPH